MIAGLDHEIPSFRGATPGPCVEPNATSLVKLAWMLIAENRDIIDWLACILDPNLAGCLQNLFDYSANVHFTFEHLGDATLMDAQERGTHCRIRIDADHICDWYLKFFEARFDRSLPDYERAAAQACILLEVAQSMLHEILHCCRTEIFGRDAWHGADVHNLGQEYDPCSLAYLIEDMFGWAMSHRYASLQHAACGALSRDRFM